MTPSVSAESEGSSVQPGSKPGGKAGKKPGSKKAGSKKADKKAGKKAGKTDKKTDSKTGSKAVKKADKKAQTIDSFKCSTSTVGTAETVALDASNSSSDSGPAAAAATASAKPRKKRASVAQSSHKKDSANGSSGKSRKGTMDRQHSARSAVSAASVASASTARSAESARTEPTARSAAGTKKKPRNRRSADAGDDARRSRPAEPPVDRPKRSKSAAKRTKPKRTKSTESALSHTTVDSAADRSVSGVSPPTSQRQQRTSASDRASANNAPTTDAASVPDDPDRTTRSLPRAKNRPDRTTASSDDTLSASRHGRPSKKNSVRQKDDSSSSSLHLHTAQHETPDDPLPLHATAQQGTEEKKERHSRHNTQHAPSRGRDQDTNEQSTSARCRSRSRSKTANKRRDRSKSKTRSAKAKSASMTASASASSSTPGGLDKLLLRKGKAHAHMHAKQKASITVIGMAENTECSAFPTDTHEHNKAQDDMNLAKRPSKNARKKSKSKTASSLSVAKSKTKSKPAKSSDGGAVDENHAGDDDDDSIDDDENADISRTLEKLCSATTSKVPSKAAQQLASHSTHGHNAPQQRQPPHLAMHFLRSKSSQNLGQPETDSEPIPSQSQRPALKRRNSFSSTRRKREPETVTDDDIANAFLLAEGDNAESANNATELSASSSVHRGNRPRMARSKSFTRENHKTKARWLMERVVDDDLNLSQHASEVAQAEPSAAPPKPVSPEKPKPKLTARDVMKQTRMIAASQGNKYARYADSDSDSDSDTDSDLNSSDDEQQQKSKKKGGDSDSSSSSDSDGDDSFHADEEEYQLKDFSNNAPKGSGRRRNNKIRFNGRSNHSRSDSESEDDDDDNATETGSIDVFQRGSRRRLVRRFTATSDDEMSIKSFGEDYDDEVSVLLRSPLKKPVKFVPSEEIERRKREAAEEEKRKLEEAKKAEEEENRPIQLGRPMDPSELRKMLNLSGPSKKDPTTDPDLPAAFRDDYGNNEAVLDRFKMIRQKSDPSLAVRSCHNRRTTSLLVNDGESDNQDLTASSFHPRRKMKRDELGSHSMHGRRPRHL